MEKTVGAFEARRQFGRILQEVVARGDKYVVERHGEAVAAVVPIDIYLQWKRRREAFFDKMREVAERANVPEDEAEDLVQEAVRQVRHQKQP